MRIDAIPKLTMRERAEVRAKCEINLNHPRLAEPATAILAALNEHEGKLADAEGAEFAAYSEEERVVQAFRRVPPTETEVKLIAVLLADPRSWSKDLTRAMGWQGDSAWHMHFGMACQRRGHLLWPAPTSEAREARDGKPATFWSGVLADYDPNCGWTMKPQAERGFAALGIKAQSRR